MGRHESEQAPITAAGIETYLRGRGYADAVVESLQPLGQSTQEGLKSYGYGRPLCVTFTAGAERHRLVFRTMSPDPFGHERRSDRCEAMVLSFDTFNELPRHIRATGLGSFDGASMLPMGRGEVFLVTEFVEGHLYAQDLHGMQSLEAPRALDLQRAEALARYLAEVHAEPRDATAYVRALRDTIGDGEGIFGLCDSYPREAAVAPPERLQAIEQQAVRWRWKLRDRTCRARRTHGDFHPFNILFRDGVDLSVLDCSRGGAGEPADDVTCLSINYLYFALAARGRFDGALRQVWDLFWDVYLEASGDDELLAVVAPFFAWRALVLASPVWYPNVADGVRDRVLRFAERLLDGARFHPTGVDALLA